MYQINQLIQDHLSKLTGYAKVFFVLAIIWYLMAFVSRKRRPISTALYGIGGTIMLAAGLFCVVSSFIYLPGKEKLKILGPIGLFLLTVLVFLIGYSFVSQKGEKEKTPEKEEDTEESSEEYEEETEELDDQYGGME